MVALAVVGCSSLLINTYTHSHEFRPGHLQLTEVNEGETKYHVIWKKPILLNTTVELDPIFSDECQVNDFAPPQVGNVALIYHWKLSCDLGQSFIHIDGLPFSHTDVLVSLDKLDGDNESYVLRPDNPSLNLKEESPSSLTYFIIGIEHLVFGIDHVLFVIGLFLFIREPIELINTITAFTVVRDYLEEMAADASCKTGEMTAALRMMLRIVRDGRRPTFRWRKSPWTPLSSPCNFAALELSQIGVAANRRPADLALMHNCGKRPIRRIQNFCALTDMMAQLAVLRNIQAFLHHFL